MVLSVVLFSGARKFWPIPFIDDVEIHGIEIIIFYEGQGFAEFFMVCKIMVSPAPADTMIERSKQRR